MGGASTHSARDSRHLPTLPVVVTRLVALYASDEYGVDDVIGVIETDPAIAGRVLRLANSAYYGFSGRVDTLRRALVLLGSATVQAVALGASLLRAWGPGQQPEVVSGLWIHAYLCGLGCRHLSLRHAEAAGRLRPDASFLVGLLHDVGKFLFAAEDAAGYAALLEAHADDGGALRAAERERFGADHAAAGSQLLGEWELPARFAALVGLHHSGGVRAELLADWELLTATNRLLHGVTPAEVGGELPAAVLADLATVLEQRRPQAEEFYRAIV